MCSVYRYISVVDTLDRWYISYQSLCVSRYVSCIKFKVILSYFQLNSIKYGQLWLKQGTSLVYSHQNMAKFVPWYVSGIGWRVSRYISYHWSGMIYSPIYNTIDILRWRIMQVNSNSNLSLCECFWATADYE